jgi:hypothetical protein
VFKQLNAVLLLCRTAVLAPMHSPQRAGNAQSLFQANKFPLKNDFPTFEPLRETKFPFVGNFGT